MSETLKSLEEIKAEVDRLAARIGAPEKLLPTYGRPIYDAHPHLEVDSRGYHYVVEERRNEIKRVTTPDLDDLLFTIFAGVTFSLAMGYEREHRVDNQDCRRVLFRRQEELLSMLSEVWGERERQRHLEILQKHPYDDQVMSRVALTQAYREQGYEPEVAWRMACQQYPLPAP